MEGGLTSPPFSTLLNAAQAHEMPPRRTRAHEVSLDEDREEERGERQARRKGLPRMPSIYAREGLQFEGKVQDFLLFLEEFEILADSFGLTSGKMARQVCKYTSPAVRGLWEVLEGYQDADYEILKKVKLDCYPEVQEARQYTPQDLEDIVEEFAGWPLCTESELADYYRAFKAATLGLRGQGDLSANEVNRAFWCGLHNSTCKRIEWKLEVLKPEHDS